MAHGKLLQTTCKREYDLRTRNDGKFQQDIKRKITLGKKTLTKKQIFLAKEKGLRKLLNKVKKGLNMNYFKSRQTAGDYMLQPPEPEENGFQCNECKMIFDDLETEGQKVYFNTHEYHTVCNDCAEEIYGEENL